MIISRVISVVLRVLELISAVIVAGIVGHYLNDADDRSFWPGSRFIYTEVISGLAIILALVLLIPFTFAISSFALDFIFFVLWIVSFGLLADFIAPMNCGWGWDWNPNYYFSNDVSHRCERWKAALAFVFLSAMFWLASSLLAMWVLHRLRRESVGRRSWLYNRTQV